MQQAIHDHPDTLYVVAAGNGGSDGIGDDVDGGVHPQVPCNIPEDNIVCVAATTETDGRAGFSNFGATSVDLGAPGTDILSTVPHFVLDDGFETGLANWTNGPGTAWSRSSTTSGGGSFSAQDSAGNYVSGADEILQTTAAVPGSGGCPLDWEMRMQTPDTGDRLFVEVSSNGTNFTSLGSISVNDPDWFPITAGNLSAGDKYIRFHFIADGDATVGDGVYIDDVKIGCVDSTPTFDGSEYAFLQGTSMATPHVAGAAALALALKPSLTVDQLKAALLSSGDPVASLNGITVTGKRLNVSKLLNTISPLPTPTPTPTPVPTPVPRPVPTPVPRPVPIPVPTPTPTPKTLADAKLSGCKVTKSKRVQCSLGSGDAVTSATMTLKNGRKTIAKATVKPRNGKLSLKLKKKLKKGSYTLTVTLKDAAGNTRKITKTIKVKR
jgi:subtilisin family serine protease